MNISPARSAGRELASSLLVILSLTAGAGACGGSGGSAGGDLPTTPVVPVTPVSTSSVSIQNTAFSPPAIVVSAGTTVSFTNYDLQSHNVTFDDATIGRSGDFGSGTRAFTMPSATGTYTYRCTLHGGMTGSVKVQ